MPLAPENSLPPAWAAESRPVAPDRMSPGIDSGGVDQLEWAKQIVLRQLTTAPRSRAQLEVALRTQSCPPDVAERVLDRMEEVGLVDDGAYAAMLVRSQQATRGLAKRALAHELRRKGVDDDTAKAALDDIDPLAEEEQARTLVVKRLRTLHGLDPRVQARRLGGLLARKGYGPEVSLRVIREVLHETEEHRRD